MKQCEIQFSIYITQVCLPSHSVKQGEMAHGIIIKLEEKHNYDVFKRQGTESFPFLEWKRFWSEENVLTLDDSFLSNNLFILNFNWILIFSNISIGFYLVLFTCMNSVKCQCYSVEDLRLVCDVFITSRGAVECCDKGPDTLYQFLLR